MKKTALVILTVMVVGVVKLDTAYSITFLRHPETQHVLLDESATFNCVVQNARDVRWYLYDGTVNGVLSERTAFVISITTVSPSEDTKNSTIIIRSVQSWNNTILKCRAEYVTSRSFSQDASLIVYISLRPFPPSHLQSTFINSSKIVISWSPNLLWDTYPISYYNITVVAIGAGNNTFTFISIAVQSIIHEFILSDHFSLPACADYSFSIASVSDLHGESDYAIINGTVGSDLNSDSGNLKITTNVYFYSNGIPFLNTEIELPKSVCLDDVLILNYMVFMISSNATITSVTSGNITHCSTGNIKFSLMSGLEKDQNYTLEITVTSKNGGSQTSTSVNFDTIFTPTIPQTCSYNSEKEKEFRSGVFYYKTVIGVCSAFTFTILIVSVAVVTYVCIQKENHKRETKLNTSANKICESMVQNPIYDGPVYESVRRQFDNLSTTTERTAADEGNTLSDRPCNSKISSSNSSEKSIRYVNQPVQMASKNFRSMSFGSGSPSLSSAAGSNPRSTSVSIPFTSKKTGKERNKLHLTLTLTENDLNATAESHKPVIRSTNPVALMDVDKNYMVMSPISVLSDSPNAVLEWSPEDTQKYKE